MDTRCEVRALCASTLERARGVADRVEVPNAYGDWREIVADPEIDAIAIATPPSIQPAIVMAALANRKHVFCEKPLATTLEAAGEMLAAARRSGLAHVADFEFSVIEEWQEARRILQRGALGRLRHVLVSWQVETYTNRLKLPSWKTSTAAGGGTLSAFASHIFYNVEWLLGPIHRLSARLFPTRGRRSLPATDTLVTLCLDLVDGTPVSVSASNNAFLGTGHRVEIYGDDGTLVLENPTSDYVKGFRLLHGARESKTLEVIRMERQASTVEDGRIIAVGRLVELFVDWIRSGIQAGPTLEDGYRVQYLLDASLKAHVSETWRDVRWQSTVLGQGTHV